MITSLMLLGNLGLLAWEWDRLAPLFSLPREGARLRDPVISWVAAGGSCGLLVYFALYAGNLALLRTGIGLAGFGIAAMGGAGLGLMLAWHVRGMVWNPRRPS